MATKIILWRRCVWSKHFAPVETGDRNIAPRTKQEYQEIPPTGYGTAELRSVYPMGTRNEAAGKENPKLLSTDKLQDRLGDNISKKQHYYLKQKGHDLYKNRTATP